MRTASLKQHYPCVYKICIQSLLMQSVQQYTGTSRRLFTPGSTVRQQPAQSTEEVWTAYLDTHHDHLWWLQRVYNTLMKTTFQTRSSPEHLKWLSVQSWEVWTRSKSKVFRNPFQSTMEYRELWRGFCRLSKNHWRQVVKKQNLNSIRKATHRH